MNIIISNRFQYLLNGLDAEIIKSIHGVFNAEEIVKELDGLFYERLILDITAIKDSNNIEVLQKLSASLDMSKIILLLDDSKEYTEPEFLSAIISMGIYNFTKNIKGVQYLLANPNKYGDVVKYHQLKKEIVKEEPKKEVEPKVQPIINQAPIDRETKYNNIYESRDLTEQQKHIMATKLKMQEVLKNNGVVPLAEEDITDIPDREEKNTLLFKLTTGFILLPILIAALTYLFYVLTTHLEGIIPSNSLLGKVAFWHFPNTSVTILYLVFILLILILMGSYYKILDEKIRLRGVTNLKFMLIPLGIVSFFVFADEFIFESGYNLIVSINNSFDTETFKTWYQIGMTIAKFAIVAGFARAIMDVLNRDVLDKDISQKLTILEKIYVFVLILLFAVPTMYSFATTLSGVDIIEKTVKYITGIPNIMIILVLTEGLLTLALIIINLIKEIKKA